MIDHTIRIRRKGQITLPAEVREDLKLDEGDLVRLRKENGKYTLVPTKSWVDRTAGALAGYARDLPPITPDDMDKIVEEEVIEDWNRFVREVEEEYDK